MKQAIALIVVFLCAVTVCFPQKNPTTRRSTNSGQKGSSGLIVDERLSVLRKQPSLYSEPIKRLAIGDKVTVFEEKSGDGVSFYRVADNTAVTGWIQVQSLVGTFRKNDDQRLVRLILGSTGFTQIHRASIFLSLFRESQIRPTVLLLFGDLIETHAAEISERAQSNLVRREMAAAQAPVHSFFLNYHELDRYRKLGIRFLFNARTRMLHYNGDAWLEITNKFPESEVSIEARERFRSLESKMKAEK